MVDTKAIIRSGTRYISLTQDPDLPGPSVVEWARRKRNDHAEALAELHNGARA
jgi:hypothetical protein